MDVFYWILGINIVLGIGFYFFVMEYASRKVFRETLTRKTKELWSRENPPEDPTPVIMDKIGHEWQAKNAHRKKDLHIVRDGLNLYGEYYDMGSDKCVMVLSGRTESLRYGYYFAIPYAENGYNVFVFDPRAHGNTDGKYNTVGFEESRDTAAWTKYICTEFGLKGVVYHGICIGAAGGMYAACETDCEKYVLGIVTEGMFIRFGESMKNHLIERKKNFPMLLWFIDRQLRRLTGHSMTRKGPINVIDKLTKPLLMLQSKADPYSTPHNAQLLFDTCKCQHKTIVYFDEGGHSLLRYVDTEKYDGAITDFLNSLQQ
jgi:pimeloyl-ACP methyl ester carboxylesterase